MSFNFGGKKIPKYDTIDPKDYDIVESMSDLVLRDKPVNSGYAALGDITVFNDVGPAGILIASGGGAKITVFGNVDHRANIAAQGGGALVTIFGKVV